MSRFYRSLCIAEIHLIILCNMISYSFIVATETKVDKKNCLHVILHDFR